MGGKNIIKRIRSKNYIFLIIYFLLNEIIILMIKYKKIIANKYVY